MSASGKTYILDVQDLPPPAPMEAVLELLPDMAPGDLLRLRHRREPYPLYRMLADLGFVHRVTTPDDVPFEILIWRSEGPLPTGLDD